MSDVFEENHPGYELLKNESRLKIIAALRLSFQQRHFHVDSDEMCVRNDRESDLRLHLHSAGLFKIHI